MTKTSRLFSISRLARLQFVLSLRVLCRVTRAASPQALAVSLALAACDTSSASTKPQSSHSPSAIESASTAAAASGPCPEGMVLVTSFCIDRYEAELVPSDPSNGDHSPYERPKQGMAYAARSERGVVPQGYISREEAALACEAAGKRLCSAQEWQTACKGKAGFKYPYGRDEVRGRCNTRKRHLPAFLFGVQPSGYREPHLNDPRLNKEPGFLARTGEYPGCVSDYGVFDMVGNLHEWVADDVNGQLPRKVPIPAGVQNMGRRGNGVFMGGYFSSGREHGRGCEYVTTHHAPDYHDYSTGFRCCKSP